MDEAPAVFETGRISFGVPHARFAARVPGPVRPVGGRGVATPSQSRKVSAGRAGRVSVAEAELGWRTSGRLAVRMRLLGPEEVDGGQWHSTLEKVWKKFRAMARQPASTESRRGGTKSARRALPSWISDAMALWPRVPRRLTLRDELSAQAGVARGDEAAEASELDVLPGGMEVDGEVGKRGGEGVCGGGGWAEGGFDAEGAGVGWAGVGADGVRFETEAPLVRPRQPEGEVGVGEREGSFDLVELEVEARAGGLDVGKAGRGAGELLGCGRCVCLGAGGLKDKALQIPVAIGGADEVDAGVGQRDAGELDAAAPERTDANVGADLAGAQDGLGAEGGVLIDHEVLQREAGDGQQIEADPVEVDGAAERGADIARDAALVAADVDVRRKKREQQKGEDGTEDSDEPAAGWTGMRC